MSEHTRVAPRWIPYLDLVCAFTAGGLWYLAPRWGWLGIALLPWAIRLALTGRPTHRTLFDLPMALFLLTALVGVWAAFDREAAWARFWLILGAVVIYYALANAEPTGDVRVWLLALLGAGAAVVFVLTNDWSASVAKIGFLARVGQALQAPLPRLPGPDANANIVGAILATLLPFAGLAALQAGRGARGLSQGERRPAWVRWAALALGLTLLLVVAFGLLMTASRGAWVAVLGALLLAAGWRVAGRLSSGSPLTQRRIFAGGLGLALVALLLLALAWRGAIPALLDALPGPSAVGSRTELWRNGLTLAADYPFTGVGHDGFMMAYSSYVMLLHVGFAPHTHNLYLDLAVEQGLPALLIFLCMCALFYRAFWRDAVRPAAQRKSALGAAALSLVVILLHGLVDDPLYTSRAVLWLFIPLGFAGALAPEGAVARQGTSRWALLGSVAGILALLAVAVLWRAPLLSRLVSNLGAVYQTQTELGVYTWPEWPIQDEVRRQKDLGPAVLQFERALALDAGNASANRRLGQIELSLGHYEAALRHLQAAYAAEPWNVTTRQLLGEAYLANGEAEVGRLLWVGVGNEQGQLEGRVWWYEHIGDKERAQRMRWAAESGR